MTVMLPFWRSGRCSPSCSPPGSREEQHKVWSSSTPNQRFGTSSSESSKGFVLLETKGRPSRKHGAGKRRVGGCQGGSPEYAVRDLLRHHQDWCVQVRGDDARHDRGVGDPHPADCVCASLAVDDGVGVDPAGAGRVVRGAGPPPDASWRSTIDHCHGVCRPLSSPLFRAGLYRLTIDIGHDGAVPLLCRRGRSSPYGVRWKGTECSRDLAS